MHHSVVLFGFISGLDFLLDVQLGASFVDILVANDSSLNINVEALAAGGKVGANLMRDGEIVSLGRDRGG